MSGALNTMAMPTESSPSKQDGGEQEKSALPDLGDLIFDVTGNNPPASAAEEETDVALPNLEDMTLNLDEDLTPVSTQARASQPKSEDGVMEFTLDFPGEEKNEKAAPSSNAAEGGFAGINLNFDEASAPATPSGSQDDHWQEVATKLDLAKAYQEMGDASGAREIIEEVLREGDTEQREAAQTLLAELD